MEYKGKLYGKLGHKYFDTAKTSEDWDNLEKKVKKLSNINREIHQKLQDMISDNWNKGLKIDELQITIEKQRIEGILLGLSIAKKAWDKDFGRNAIYENEILYQEELAKLS